VILGVEMAQLSELGVGGIEDEVKFLWELGIRQVFPVHGPDNKLAGAAVFQDIYNTVTDLLYRDPMNIWHADDVPDKFMQVEEGCPYDGDPDCARYKLDPPMRAVLANSVFGKMPFVAPARTEYKHLEPARGHRNVHGLSDTGKAYIKLLMNHGMLVDLAHMSQHSVEGVYSILGERSSDPACSKIGFEDVPAQCYESAYPLVVSHAHFRSLSAHNDRTTFKGYQTQEYQVSDHQADMLRRTGGLVGQFVTEYPIATPDVGPQDFRNDCGMSSKSFAYSFLYGLQKMDRRGVGIASDVTFIPMVSPRFESKACSGYIQADHPSQEKKAWPDQYGHNKDQDERTRVKYGDHGLKQYCVLHRCFDFNTEGFSHYGMLPDMLQDLRNLGLRSSDFEALFNSAEGYLETWEKAESLAVPEFRPGLAEFHPLKLDCKIDCHGLCPKDENAGAPKGPTKK
jgi:microsomal dipeptidase-like Zn-dependent dipeptidase